MGALAERDSDRRAAKSLSRTPGSCFFRLRSKAAGGGARQMPYRGEGFGDKTIPCSCRPAHRGHNEICAASDGTRVLQEFAPRAFANFGELRGSCYIALQAALRTSLPLPYYGPAAAASSIPRKPKQRDPRRHRHSGIDAKMWAPSRRTGAALQKPPLHGLPLNRLVRGFARFRRFQLRAAQPRSDGATGGGAKTVCAGIALEPATMCCSDVICVTHQSPPPPKRARSRYVQGMHLVRAKTATSSSAISLPAAWAMAASISRPQRTIDDSSTVPANTAAHWAEGDT